MQHRPVYKCDDRPPVFPSNIMGFRMHLPSILWAESSFLTMEKPDV